MNVHPTEELGTSLFQLFDREHLLLTVAVLDNAIHDSVWPHEAKLLRTLAESFNLAIDLHDTTTEGA